MRTKLLLLCLIAGTAFAQETTTTQQTDAGPSTVLTAATQYPRRIVVEENTGMWCGFCPRGIVGLKNLKAKYPGKCITIAVHYNDEFQISAGYKYSYMPYLKQYAKGFPFCWLNRQLSGDPYDDADYDVSYLLGLGCSIDYTLQLSYDETSKTVTGTVTTTSANDLSNVTYKTAFVVIEDGVKTTENQSNYYANGRYGAMGGFEKMGSYVSGLVMDDVARGIFSTWEGDVCTPSNIKALDPVQYTYSFKLPETVKDPQNVRIAAMLINSGTKEILNAAEVNLKDATTGIGNATAAPAITARATADGNISVESQEPIKGTATLVSVDGKTLATTAVEGTHAVLPANNARGICFVKVVWGNHILTTKVAVGK
jgi:thiol-disulfide isomerase/thioredoxin